MTHDGRDHTIFAVTRQSTGENAILFTNDIDVALLPQEAFSVLTDMERVAPCLPGARIEGRDGDDYLGAMSVKIGPLNATYRGRLRFVELDAERRTVVIKARADEVNGQGSAEAAITLSVADAEGGGSRIGVETDLQIRGRLAQVARGAMGSIIGRLLADFATNLEQSLAAGTAPSAAGEPAPAREPAGRQAAGTTPIEIASMIPPGLRVAAVGAVGAVLGFMYGYLLGRLRERGRRKPT